MANYVKVSVPKMKSKTEELQSAISNSMKAAKDLQGSIAILDKYWEGQAWETFKKTFYSDIQYINETYKWLNSYLEKMSEAEEKYYKCDEQNHKEMSNIRI